ncbi:MAG TPA: protein kinase [Vicinamibacterales bacterium]|nr:protein kinase [Vicinamibacterales bacterium]
MTIERPFPTPGNALRDLAGRYRIVREIGRGGMATVFLADDLKHRRSVAVKVMSPASAHGLDRDRFLREIEIAARLSHPHVVPLFDSGAAGDDLYYVMPFVAGESLRERLARDGQLPVVEALRLGREIASALGHAHQHGLVHRDLKPENILLADGIPLVADFGVARPIAVASDDRTRAETIAGSVVGTPQYMSPEQVCGEDVDARADIYSLACVVFEMLAGRPPFLATGVDSVLRQHLMEPPPAVDAIRPDIPSSLAHVIARGMAKRPGDRYATAVQFAEALTAAAAGARTPSPPPAADQATPHNLPAERTQFIGRERELATCARLLGETRVLTLTALGGCGKTRLALKLAEHLLGTFPDGVWFVDLAPVRDGERVIDAIAGAIGVRETADRDLTHALVASLGRKHVLVILDNCEHLIEEVRATADRLLEAEAVRILATSREGLGLDGERLFAVRSLSVPAAGPVRAADAEASEAVRLFVDRARRIAADFELTAANAGAVVEICRRLDGIPLAIELAAARVKVLSVMQIRDRLDDAFRLLTGGAKGALGRHQTLEATIEWSHDQLTPEEQRLFRWLAVFAGGWSFETLARMSGDSDEFETLDRLSRLVDKSLVLVDRPQGHEPRYALLETVRQFAAARLRAAGEAGDARARHVDEFAAMAERAYASRLVDEDRWLNILSLEHDNLRAALHALRAADGERHLQLCGALAWFWVARSHLFEGREHLMTALQATPADPPRPARARALAGVAGLLAWQGDKAAAAAAWRDSLSLWRQIGDQAEVALALEGAGWAHFVAGDDEDSYATFQEYMRVQRATGNVHLLNRAFVGVGQLAVALGHLDEARDCAHAILEYVKVHPNTRSEHLAWHYLADCALIAEQYADSLKLYRRSLALALDLGDHVEIGFEVQGVAMSLAGLGADADALRLVAGIDAQWTRIGANIRVRFWGDLLDRHIEPARLRLGVDAARTWSEGAALPLDATVQLALTCAVSA